MESSGLDLPELYIQLKELEAIDQRLSDQATAMEAHQQNVRMTLPISESFSQSMALSKEKQDIVSSLQPTLDAARESLRKVYCHKGTRSIHIFDLPDGMLALILLLLSVLEDVCSS